MKLYKIEMKDVYQFDDITIDLTYPAGHEKAGQPLDKVCIIGQSGTGKTKLLELIRDSLALGFKEHNFRYYEEDDELNLLKGENILSIPNVYLTYLSRESEIIVEGLGPSEIESIGFKYQKDFNNYAFRSFVQLNNSKIEYEDLYGLLNDKFLLAIYYPHNLSTEKNAQRLNLKHSVIDFEQINIGAAWREIVNDIKEYRANRFLASDKFAEASSKEPEKAKEYSMVFRKWEQDNPNPLENLAEKLDEILCAFYLKIKLENTLGTIEHLDSIPVQHLKSGKEFDFFELSTGTQRIINTGIPLYQLKPKEAIIIFDEVENSLYPDIQKIIIDYYTGLAPNCQFFFATHSPIIASNFEPWEIVELKFNKEGKVYREEYYKGERHVDNYFIHPKLLRWDEILTDVFDMKEAGNEKRNEKLQELASLGAQIKALQKKEAPEIEINQKITEYKKVAGLLNWNVSL